MYWSRYRAANPVPTSQLVDDIATVPSGPVMYPLIYSAAYIHWLERTRGIQNPDIGHVSIRHVSAKVQEQACLEHECRILTCHHDMKSIDNGNFSWFGRRIAASWMLLGC